MDGMTGSDFGITDRAAARISEIGAAEGRPAALRVQVLAGGCSGFQYRFDLVTETTPDDLLVERDGARVVVDPISLGFLRGAELDFVDDLIGAQFKLNNPNVTAACGCGTSFSID
jgi:iron-sulfur cluster assembly accessory protein